MFSNCILREEDGYTCPGQSKDHCKICPYYYRGSLPAVICGFFIGALMIVSIIAGAILAVPFILIGILFEAIDA